MKNWKMWLAAIGINIFANIIFWQLNPKAESEFDFRGLFLLFYLITFNFVIGIFIATYNGLKGKKFEGYPFLIISILLLLVGLGVCYL